VSDFNGLVIFAAVAEAKSFSEAARRLNMPLASVSRRVADLERELGVRLLERSTRNLRLTEVGTEVLEYAQRSAEICEAVDSIVSNHQATVSGLLRLSAPPNISDSCSRHCYAPSVLPIPTCAFKRLSPSDRSTTLRTAWISPSGSARSRMHRWSRGEYSPTGTDWWRVRNIWRE